MKVRVYLFPRYVFDDIHLETFLPRLAEILVERGVAVERMDWNGELSTLPTDGPALILWSSQLREFSGGPSDQELAARCFELGHLLFYDDKLVYPNGSFAGTVVELLYELNKFLDKIGATRAVSHEPCPAKDRVDIYLMRSEGELPNEEFMSIFLHFKTCRFCLRKHVLTGGM